MRVNACDINLLFSVWFGSFCACVTDNQIDHMIEIGSNILPASFTSSKQTNVVSDKIPFVTTTPLTACI